MIMKKVLFFTLMMVTALGLAACQTTEETTVTTVTEVSSNVLYVNVLNNESGDGLSWDTAYLTLQEALAVAESGNDIWIAAGTYYPADEDSYFQMIDDVDVYGGFAGTETSFDQRNWETNVTILSGDLGTVGDSSDNSSHIVIAANSTLDGFTISDATSSSGMMMPPIDGDVPEGDIPDKSTTEEEGGTDVGHSSPDEVMSGDATTTENGAAIVIWEVSPTISNCILENNSAGKGGAVYVVATRDLDSLPTFINVTFDSNSAFARGGAVCLDMGGDAIFIDSVFINNECDGKGGAVYNDFGSSPMFENCLFINNTASSGAAMANDGVSNPIISNCTFYGNVATEAGAALYSGTGPFNAPIVIDTIIYGNVCEYDEASIYQWNESFTTVSYSIVEGGFNGEYIYDEDPLFVDAENLDFSLSSESSALTMSSDSGSIGYDNSLVSERTDADYEALADYLDSINIQAESTSIDLTNPLSGTDVSEVGTVIYVTTDGTGNGSTWTLATSDLQTAIDLANAKYVETAVEVSIYVAAGTYYTGDERSDSFTLREGVHLYGGFSGTETSFEERDLTTNETVLSGNIGDLEDETDNSYHVLIGADNCILDGFTVSDGYADGVDGEVYDNKGGGLLNYLAGNPVIPTYEPTLGFDITITNCLFENNYAVEGGAIYTYHGGNPVIEDTVFSNNSAVYGGATVDRAGVNSTYTNVTFVDNYAEYKGGAVFVDYGSMATFEDCDFTSNEAGSNGGAVYVIDRASQSVLNETDFDEIDDTWELLEDIFSSVLIINSTFEDNVAGNQGGAVYAFEGSYVKIVTSTFTGNTATNGAGAIGVFYGSHLIQDDLSEFTETSDTVIK